MIRVVRTRRYRELVEAERQLGEFESAQEAAREALTSPNRKERRRAHRESWSRLPSSSPRT